jgi:hypothetical protein
MEKENICMTFISIYIIISLIVYATFFLPTAFATIEKNTDEITCNTKQGTTMAGIFHRSGECQGENGFTAYGGAFNTGSKACEGHALKGPNNNLHFRGGCLNN